MQFRRPPDVLVAEGNPDEEKIGAFGAGFYSLFSVTEGPSGEKWMGFYWKDKKDRCAIAVTLFPAIKIHVHKLFARRGNLPHKTHDPFPNLLSTSPST